MDIATLDIKDLKALAYDELVKIEMSQQNLRLINTELAKHSEAPKSETKSVKA